MPVGLDNFQHLDDVLLRGSMPQCTKVLENVHVKFGVTGNGTGNFVEIWHLVIHMFRFSGPVEWMNLDVGDGDSLRNVLLEHSPDEVLGKWIDSIRYLEISKFDLVEQSDQVFVVEWQSARKQGIQD